MTKVKPSRRTAGGLAAALILCLLVALSFPAGASNLPNPALPGEYKVQALTYGSGTDLHRPEYGKDVTIQTAPADGTAVLGCWTGKDGKSRTKYWGFGPDALPLNGRVWYPDGQGPFPLVLMVHGNHDMKKFSDPGYAYLGELLASRGIIAVSVDENFLNGGNAGDFRGQENLARAWMMLKHLELWKQWNGDSASPFYQKVDLDKLALIGHSRGGEAVATAAALNRLTHMPDNALVRLDFGFNIQSVVAIAPADGQYQPSGRLPWLQDVNYLVLQGSNDSDVSIFLGDRQYQRVRFDEEGTYRFKTSLYISRANHGQFNTTWGRNDLGVPSWLLNLKPLMDGEEQRTIAKVYISAFLESTLKGRTEYIPMFRDPRMAADWLPKTDYVSQFEDSRYRAVSNFEEDMDVTTTTVPGGTQGAENLSAWFESVLRFRNGMSRDNHVVFLGWNPEKRGSYAISLPADLGAKWGLSADSMLVFSLADGVGLAGYQGKRPDLDLDLSVELQTSDGIAVRLPLSRFSALQRAMEVRFTNWKRMERKFYANPTEPVLQRYEIPLSVFSEAGTGFDPSRIQSIRFAFDRGGSGCVILDDLGFRLAE